MASPKTLADRAKREALEEYGRDHPKFVKIVAASTRNQKRTAHKKEK